MSTRILAPPSRTRNAARDTTVGETVVKARVKNTRRTLVQCCVLALQRCSMPYRPTNDRATTTRATKRCTPISARLSRQHLALLGGTGDRRQNRVLRSCCCCGSRSSADKHEHKKSNQAFLHLEIPPPISRFQGGSDRGLPGDLQGKSSGFREEREDRVSAVCCLWHSRRSHAAGSGRTQRGVRRRSPTLGSFDSCAVRRDDRSRVGSTQSVCRLNVLRVQSARRSATPPP